VIAIAEVAGGEADRLAKARFSRGIGVRICKRGGRLKGASSPLSAGSDSPRVFQVGDKIFAVTIWPVSGLQDRIDSRLQILALAGRLRSSPFGTKSIAYSGRGRSPVWLWRPESRTSLTVKSVDALFGQRVLTSSSLKLANDRSTFFTARLRREIHEVA